VFLLMSRPSPRRWLLALLAAAGAVLLSPSLAAADDFSFGAVYTQTNTLDNQVVVYDRAFNGRITEVDRVPTGGAGAPSTPPFGFPIVDSQGSVELADNGRLLFVVNAGSDTISSFRVGFFGFGSGLRLADQESSGGDLPISLDSRNGVLYVLNELSGDISGLRYDSLGRMTPIPGSTESLTTPGPGGVSAQIGFDRKGRVLTVTNRGTSTIDTFKLGANNTPGPATSNASNAPTPFGFAYDPRNRLIVSNAGVVGDPGDLTLFQGTASSYRQSAAGVLTPLDNEPGGGRATCWVVVTDSGRYAFMTNTLSASVARLRIENDGKLTLLGTTPTTSNGGPADLALSRNGRHLYVLSPLEPVSGPFVSGSIDVYRVGSSGSLTHLQSTASNLPPGASGMAAR